MSITRCVTRVTRHRTALLVDRGDLFGRVFVRLVTSVLRAGAAAVSSLRRCNVNHRRQLRFLIRHSHVKRTSPRSYVHRGRHQDLLGPARKSQPVVKLLKSRCWNYISSPPFHSTPFCSHFTPFPPFPFPSFPPLPFSLLPSPPS